MAFYWKSIDQSHPIQSLKLLYLINLHQALELDSNVGFIVVFNLIFVGDFFF